PRRSEVIAKRRGGQADQMFENLAELDRAQLEGDDLVAPVPLADPGGLGCKVVVAEQDAKRVSWEFDADVARGIKAKAIDVEAAREMACRARAAVRARDCGGGPCRDGQRRSERRELPTREDRPLDAV